MYAALLTGGENRIGSTTQISARCVRSSMLRDATGQAVTKTGVEEKQPSTPSHLHSMESMKITVPRPRGQGLGSDSESSRLFTTPRRRTMPIDYSKWAALDCSDSDEESAPKPPAPKKVQQPATAKLPPPKDAKGSDWNASNYHWEEQKLDMWGKQRLTELLAPKKASSEEIEFKGTRMAFTFTVRASSMEGDAWTHIRKGKSVVGYNFEAAVTLAGKVKTSSREESVSAEIEMDLMVDNEPDVNINITEGNNLPFVSLINKAILNHIKSSIAQFITDLAAKAEGQKNKVESEASSPAPSSVTTSKADADSTGAAGQESVAKSHFGGRVQVGGHQAGGLRIS